VNLLPAPRRLILLLALALYLGLSLVTVREIGVVGEVDLSWALGRPPQVLVAFDPPTWGDGSQPPTAGHRWGPLVASQVRPIESLALGPLHLPLAVNAYTGGPPDWPARLLWVLSGSRSAVTALQVLFGGVLIALVHRFLSLRATEAAANAAALLLATDWAFLFYRKVLGGTEIALQAAGLLCLWALWSRRWGGGRHGLLALGIGIGLGVMAKITFLFTLLALLAAALLTRWDKPALNPPLSRGLWTGGLAVLLLTSPLWLSALHHGLALDAHIYSHDFPQMQVKRVLSALSGGSGPSREGVSNLWLYISEPLAFFGPAYGLPSPPPPSPARLGGFVLVLAGIALGWRGRHPTPHEALLRFCSVYLLLQLGLLWLAARDLHQLAQAAPTIAITAGLALSQLASSVGPARSLRHRALALALCLPLATAGVLSLARTDEVVRQLPVPSFTERGQAAIVALLRSEGVSRLLVADYESYGMLELRAPEIEVLHAWPAVTGKGSRALPELLRAAEGAHLLVMRASQPMGYNLRPSERQVQEGAAALGLSATRLGEVRAADGEEGAVLYAIGR